MELTIETGKLTVTDWIAIAESVGNSKLWGHQNWLKSADDKTLSLENWKVLGEALGYKSGWAYIKLGEQEESAA